MQPDEPRRHKEHETATRCSWRDREHDSIVRQLQQIDLGGDPTHWQVTDDGRPKALAELVDGGDWFDMPCLQQHMPNGPLRLPRFDVSPPIRGRSRPPIRDLDPSRAAELEAAAWLTDIGGLSYHELSRKRTADATDATRVQAARDAKQGRRRLQEIGVIPWTAFDESLPDEWWRDYLFWFSFAIWLQQTDFRGDSVRWLSSGERDALHALHYVIHLLTASLEGPRQERPKGQALTQILLALAHAKNARDRLYNRGRPPAV